MQGKFEEKGAIEYFLQYSTKNVEACYSYFKAIKIADQNKHKIFDSEKEVPSFAEKLLFVYTSLDTHYQSNIFLKSEPTLIDDTDVVNKSVSPIPSVQLTGNYINIILK